MAKEKIDESLLDELLVMKRELDGLEETYVNAEDRIPVLKKKLQDMEDLQDELKTLEKSLADSVTTLETKRNEFDKAIGGLPEKWRELVSVPRLRKTIPKPPPASKKATTTTGKKSVEDKLRENLERSKWYAESEVKAKLGKGNFTLSKYVPAVLQKNDKGEYSLV